MAFIKRCLKVSSDKRFFIINSYIFIGHDCIRGPPVRFGIFQFQIKKQEDFIMKKFEIVITTKQGEKKVKLYIDNETATILKDCSEEIRLAYLKEEYKAQMRERAETRRHISLDKSMDNGHDFESQDKSPLAEILEAEEESYIKSLLDKLTDKQREVFILHAFERWTLKKIGKKMGVSFQCVHQIYEAAIKKLKNFYKTP